MCIRDRCTVVSCLLSYFLPTSFVFLSTHFALSLGFWFIFCWWNFLEKCCIRRWFIDEVLLLLCFFCSFVPICSVNCLARLIINSAKWQLLFSLDLFVNNERIYHRLINNTITIWFYIENSSNAWAGLHDWLQLCLYYSQDDIRFHDLNPSVNTYMWCCHFMLCSEHIHVPPVLPS